MTTSGDMYKLSKHILTRQNVDKLVLAHKFKSKYLSLPLPAPQSKSLLDAIRTSQDRERFVSLLGEELFGAFLDHAILVHADDQEALPAVEPRKQIVTVYVYVTDSCNLRCRYCLSGVSSETTILHTKRVEDYVRNIVESFFDLHTLGVVFFGGEPLLNWPAVRGLVRSIEAMHVKARAKWHLTFSVNTNLTVWHEDFASFCAEHAIGVMTNLDGPEPVHNALRPHRQRRNSFRLTMRNLESVVKRCPTVAVKTNLCSVNVRLLARTSLLLHDAGVSNLVWSVIRPVTRDKHAPFPDLLPQADVLEASVAEALDACHGLVANIDPADEYNDVLCGDRSPCAPCDARRGGIVAIGTDGAAYPCVWLTHDQAHRIGENGALRPDARSGTSLETAFTATSRHCSGCQYDHVCGFVCPVTDILCGERSPAARAYRRARCVFSRAIVSWLIDKITDSTKEARHETGNDAH